MQNTFLDLMFVYRVENCIVGLDIGTENNCSALQYSPVWTTIAVSEGQPSYICFLFFYNLSEKCGIVYNTY